MSEVDNTRDATPEEEHGDGVLTSRETGHHC
jgi:hypothetical protein